MATTHNLPNLVSIPSGYKALNAPALDLANLAMWHQLRIGETGMLAAPPEAATTSPMGSQPNPAATQRRVWLDEPPGSVPFDEQGTIPIPMAAPAGIDTAVLSFYVPKGYDGVIKWISNNVANAAFVSGSGALVWRILVNHRPVRNFGNILVEKGTVAQGRQVSPIRLFSGDLVEYVISQVAPSAITGQTTCSLTGYFFPSKGVS